MAGAQCAGLFDAAVEMNQQNKGLEMMDTNFSDFEMVVSRSSDRRNKNTGFSRNPSPIIRLGLHASGKHLDGSPKKCQLSIGLNAAAMKLARFVAGDKINLLFSKDRAMMLLERHPKGQWTLSPTGAMKAQRDAAVGNAESAAIKLTAPLWALGKANLEAGFMVDGANLAFDSCRLLAQVNLDALT